MLSVRRKEQSVRYHLLAWLALTSILACRNADSPIRPSVPDPAPANPDVGIVVILNQTRYTSPAFVTAEVLNRSGEMWYLWNQCLPSAEVWDGYAWRGLPAICTAEAPFDLPDGKIGSVHANLGTPGYYRIVFAVSRSGLSLTYRSTIFRVE
jgi:hypothetical protein